VNDPRAFRRHDDSSDTGFYRSPRYVEHIDDGAIAAMTGIYRARLPEGGRIVDLMSSWTSHLPCDVRYGYVAGLGMNAAELAANVRLDERVVQDLNRNVALPWYDASFDAAVIGVSVQYLTRPLEIFADLARVVRPGGSLVVSFSNRCFPTKAVAIWQALDDVGHVALVTRYLEEAGGWLGIENLVSRPAYGDPLFAVLATRA